MENDQFIICELAGSRTTIEKHFGTDAYRAALQISEIVTPYMRDSVIHPHYEMYIATQYDGIGIPADRRIFSNLLPGCPIFYQKKPSDYPYIEHGYLKGLWAPESLLSQTKQLLKSKMVVESYQTIPCTWKGPSAPIECQVVLSRNKLRDKYRVRMFGGNTLELVQEIDALTDAIIGIKKWHICGYDTYVLRQFIAGGHQYYEGIALTNLLPGMPVFYPRYQKPFPANAQGGFQDFQLPRKALEQIAALDFGNACLKPQF